MSETLQSHGRAALTTARPALVKLGRLGWLTKGVVYILAGVLALVVGFRSLPSPLPSGEEASPTGAIKTVGQMRGGRGLLITLGVGLLLYALWRVATAILPGRLNAEAMAMRIGYLVSAGIYATFAITAFTLARRPREAADGNAKVTDISVSVLDARFGRFVLGAVGAIAVGAGLFRIVKALRGDVTDELTLQGMSSRQVWVTKKLGIIGEIGRGIAVVLIGFFLTRAAIDRNAREATGLDGALTRLAHSEWGRFVVGIVAVGFLLYGVMCVATFQRRTLHAP